MFKVAGTAVAALILTPTLAVAQASPNLARAEITQRKLVEAEATLLKANSASPNEPEVLLNLAAVYGLSGRADEARDLYGRVLRGENASLILSSSRTANAHEIARKGLRLLESRAPVQFTSR